MHLMKEVWKVVDADEVEEKRSLRNLKYLCNLLVISLVVKVLRDSLSSRLLQEVQIDLHSLKTFQLFHFKRGVQVGEGKNV